MPELPEVETVRRGLKSAISGFKVVGVEILDERSLRRNKEPYEAFKEELVGSEFNDFCRRGKFLWFPISSHRCLVAHLGMSGQIIVRGPDYPSDKCERVRLMVSKSQQNLEMRFIDQRLFGGLHMDTIVESSNGEQMPFSARHIALDPLDAKFNAVAVAAIIQKRQAGIKSLLMNQEIVSGIGNIYADEILWLAKVHYSTSGSQLSKKKILEILKISQEILCEAVNKGGTSFDEQYKNVNGESGRYSHLLNAYGQTGLPCKRCKTSIRREAWSNRGSHFCPRCQKPSNKA